MAKKILLTGATKFTGKHVCKELLSRGSDFDCLVRPSSDTRELKSMGATFVEGDLGQTDELVQILRNYQTVINVPNLAKLDVPPIISAYEKAGIQRAVFVSSTGIFTELDARTKPLRKAAEKSINESSLRATILRPTMIYGTPQDENIARLLRLCQRSPVVPIVGAGRALQQPVHVEDLAWALVEVLDKEVTIGKSYNVGGGQVLSFNELVKSACLALGKQPLIVHIPSQPAAWGARVTGGIGIPFPVSEEQILRLAEDKAYNIEDAKQDFGYDPRSFDEGVRQEVALM